ncbi:hypothetical protein ColLi_12216 [Colletotrichum liriopes]|uniref:Uncharacterized protein n=1 Tax=Colletotrichum liriopes TaxID=708192 RepID=A0AA37H0K1_9PEZI|nr:hypothetical protein ColLi_12216 [Colletotrichum liriopes]
MSTKASTDKLGANLETDNVNPDSFDYDCAQTVVQSKAGHVEHDETKNKLVAAKGATADDVVSESHINLEPEQPPSEKQIARAQWEEEEVKTA